MTKSAAQPRLAYQCAHILSNHYPERLGAAICVLPGPAFKALWSTCRVLLPPATAAKVKVIQSREKVWQTLEAICSPETLGWLTAEINLNRHRKSMLESQRSFWKRESSAPGGAHDPRGTSEYVQNWLKGRRHRPHPNIFDAISGIMPKFVEVAKRSSEEEDVVDEDEDEEVLVDFEETPYLTTSSNTTAAVTTTVEVAK